MSDRTWQQIAKELTHETSPLKRRLLEEELSMTLKSVGFEQFGKRDDPSEPVRTRSGISTRSDCHE